VVEGSVDRPMLLIGEDVHGVTVLRRLRSEREGARLIDEIGHGQHGAARRVVDEGENRPFT
jgi:hypothetical protein